MGEERPAKNYVEEAPINQLDEWKDGFKTDSRCQQTAVLYK